MTQRYTENAMNAKPKFDRETFPLSIESGI